MVVDRADLAYWDVRADRFVVEGGTYRIEVGSSSRDIAQTVTADVPGDDVRLPLTTLSSIGEVLAHPVAGPLLQQMTGAPVGGGSGSGLLGDPTIAKMLASFPIGRIASFPGSGFDMNKVRALIEAANS